MSTPDGKTNGIRSKSAMRFATSRDLRYRFIVSITFIGGAAALAHQLLWTRRLIDLLGGSHESSTRVFGVFFLGLAIGSILAARWLPRIRRPWRFLAQMELGIGLFALPVAFLPWWSGWLWPALGQEALIGAWGGWAKWIASVLCILPPSVCMGFFIPVVARVLFRENLAASEGRMLMLYAANTFGGVAGLGFTVVIAIHLFGFLGAMMAAVCMNLLVAAGCALLACVPADQSIEDASPIDPTEGEAHRLSPALCRVLAFLSGATVLSLEVLLITLLGLVVPLSFYGPAAMLALVLLALAVAAWIVALPVMRKLDPGVLLGYVLIAASLMFAISPLGFHFLAAKFPALVQAQSLGGFMLKLTLLVTLAFGVAMVLVGMVFPLVIRMSEQTRSGGGARSWGWLLAWNGVGAFLGAEFTYRFLLPAAGVHAAFGWIAASSALMAIGLACYLRFRRGVVFVSLAGIACMTLVIPQLPKLPVINPHLGFHLLETLSGREGVVNVVEMPGDIRGILLSNQYLLGSTIARPGQERQAHLPLMLHPNPARVGFLGVATGSTPTGALSHTAVQSLDAVEISPLVVEAARRHFEDLSGPLFQDPRARVVTEDARTWFAASPGQYDVIVADLFQPWGAGEGRLFSRENYTDIRGALTSGGVFCHWLPGYQLTREEFDVILATFASVFETVEIFSREFNPSAPVIGLVGWKDGRLDWETVKLRCAQERRSGGVRDPSVRHAESLRLLHSATFRRADADMTTLNTLNNNYIELRAGLRQIRGQGSTNTFQFQEWLGWLREQAGVDPLAMRLHEAEFRAFASRTPLATSELGRELWDDFPATIRSDVSADWNLWPGTIRPQR